MKLSIENEEKIIEFEVVYRKRKTLSIQIDLESNIKVIAPIGVTDNKIKDIVKSKDKWINKKLIEIQNMKRGLVERNFEDGDILLYLGEKYSLRIHIDKSLRSKYKIELTTNEIQVYVSKYNKDLIKNILKLWYKQKTEEKAKERIKFYQRFFDEVPTKIKAKEQKRRWASCTSKRGILLNWRCIMASPDVFDYIIVHEMCHMKYMNHSKDFWDLVENIIPDYKLRKDYLRENSMKMEL